jgi:hypothetical protein
VLDLDADHVGHGGGVHEVDVGRAVFAVVVVFPVLHEDADHLVALLLEQVGGDGGIHPPERPTTTRCLFMVPIIARVAAMAISPVAGGIAIARVLVPRSIL